MTYLQALFGARSRMLNPGDSLTHSLPDRGEKTRQQQIVGN